VGEANGGMLLANRTAATEHAARAEGSPSLNALHAAQAIVGSPAPELRLRGAEGQPLSLGARDGEPNVVAFLDDCECLTSLTSPTIGVEDAGAAGPLGQLRAELRGLGAAAVIVSCDGVWRFRPDDDLQLCASSAELDLASLVDLRRTYGAELGALSLFLVDGRGTLRFARTIPSSGAEALHTLVDALSSAGRALTLARGTRVVPAPVVPIASLVSRRELVVTSLLGAFALVLAEACRSPAVVSHATALEAGALPAVGTAYDVDVTLDINGATRTLRIDPRVSLLDALRERLGLTGTKKGCDHGQCGACTVLVDDRRVNACLTLAIMVQRGRITTIEGLSTGDALHPMQAAFAVEDGFQCGYCTPGQIMSAVALLKEGRAHTDDEVREQMSGNICRCGAYSNIVSAIQIARKHVTT
jgi:xanthine dehydrogenase YagT iron-sulfur-binding subunit